MVTLLAVLGFYALKLVLAQVPGYGAPPVNANITDLAPVVVIMVLIIAAAGVTRGADIFAFAGISALAGASQGGAQSGGSGKGLRSGKVSATDVQGTKSYAAGALSAAGGAIKTVQQRKEISGAINSVRGGSAAAGAAVGTAAAMGAISGSANVPPPAPGGRVNTAVSSRGGMPPSTPSNTRRTVGSGSGKSLGRLGGQGGGAKRAANTPQNGSGITSALGKLGGAIGGAIGVGGRGSSGKGEEGGDASKSGKPSGKATGSPPPAPGGKAGPSPGPGSNTPNRPTGTGEAAASAQSVHQSVGSTTATPLLTEREKRQANVNEAAKNYSEKAKATRDAKASLAKDIKDGKIEKGSKEEKAALKGIQSKEAAQEKAKGGIDKAKDSREDYASVLSGLAATVGVYKDRAAETREAKSALAKDLESGKTVRGSKEHAAALKDIETKEVAMHKAHMAMSKSALTKSKMEGNAEKTQGIKNARSVYRAQNVDWGKGGKLDSVVGSRTASVLGSVAGVGLLIGAGAASVVLTGFGYQAGVGGLVTLPQSKSVRTRENELNKRLSRRQITIMGKKRNYSSSMPIVGRFTRNAARERLATAQNYAETLRNKPTLKANKADAKEFAKARKKQVKEAKKTIKGVKKSENTDLYARAHLLVGMKADNAATNLGVKKDASQREIFLAYRAQTSSIKSKYQGQEQQARLQEARSSFQTLRQWKLQDKSFQKYQSGPLSGRIAGAFTGKDVSRKPSSAVTTASVAVVASVPGSAAAAYLGPKLTNEAPGSKLQTTEDMTKTLGIAMKNGAEPITQKQVHEAYLMRLNELGLGGSRTPRARQRNAAALDKDPQKMQKADEIRIAYLRLSEHVRSGGQVGGKGYVPYVPPPSKSSITRSLLSAKVGGYVAKRKTGQEKSRSERKTERKEKKLRVEMDREKNGRQRRVDAATSDYAEKFKAAKYSKTVLDNGLNDGTIKSGSKEHKDLLNQVKSRDEAAKDAKTELNSAKVDYDKHHWVNPNFLGQTPLTPPVPPMPAPPQPVLTPPVKKPPTQPGTPLLPLPPTPPPQESGSSSKVLKAAADALSETETSRLAQEAMTKRKEEFGKHLEDQREHREREKETGIRERDEERSKTNEQAAQDAERKRHEDEEAEKKRIAAEKKKRQQGGEEKTE